MDVRDDFSVSCAIQWLAIDLEDFVANLQIRLVSRRSGVIEKKGSTTLEDWVQLRRKEEAPSQCALYSRRPISWNDWPVVAAAGRRRVLNPTTIFYDFHRQTHRQSIKMVEPHNYFFSVEFFPQVIFYQFVS